MEEILRKEFARLASLNDGIDNSTLTKLVKTDYLIKNTSAMCEIANVLIELNKFNPVDMKSL